MGGCHATDYSGNTRVPGHLRADRSPGVALTIERPVSTLRALLSGRTGVWPSLVSQGVDFGQYEIR